MNNIISTGSNIKGYLKIFKTRISSISKLKIVKY